MTEEQVAEQVEVVEEVQESVADATPEPNPTQEIKEEIKLMRDHMDLMARNLQKPPEQSDDYRDPVEVLQQEVAKQRVQIQEERVNRKYNDYEEVITKYLPLAIKDNPQLMNELRSTDFETAYFVAKSSKAYIKDKAFAPKTKEAQKIVENSETIGSISGIGSATAGDATPNFAKMDDEEFMNYKRGLENL